MYVVNVKDDGFENNLYFEVVCKYVESENVLVVVVCVVIEVEIVDFDDVDKEVFFVDMGMEELGFDCVICVGFKLFGL